MPDTQLKAPEQALIPASVATATATATASASEKAPQAKPTTTTKQPIPSVLQHADDGVRDITLSLYYYSFVSLSLPTQRRYYKRHSAKYLFVPAHRLKRSARYTDAELAIKPITLESKERDKFVVRFYPTASATYSVTLGVFFHKASKREVVSGCYSMTVTNLISEWSTALSQGNAIRYPSPKPESGIAQLPSQDVLDCAAQLFLLILATKRSWGWEF